MAAVAQYITIVDKSNKVVGTSKQLRNVFKEAKLAYQERKAEIVAERKRKEDVELQKAIRAVNIQDETERGSEITSVSRNHTRRRRSAQHGHAGGRRGSPESHYDYLEQRPPMDRHRSSASARGGQGSPGDQSPRHNSGGQMSLGEFNAQLYGDQQGTSRSQPPSPLDGDGPPHELVRAHTEMDLAHRRPSQPMVRSYSQDDVDLDLAYGEYHPESLDLSPEQIRSLQLQKPEEQQKELSSLVLKCKLLLDEANCAQHSAKAIIAHLQKNPDAMAAVALTLAEISNIVSKMAPGAIATLSKSAPAVLALLASPQFLVAVGVGVGVTVVAFGGYKIVKRIREKMGDGPEEGMDEALDVGELDRIEKWRRGIADSQVRGVAGDADETGSIVSHATGTSVEGEFISPFAAASMGHLPLKEKKHKKSKEDEKKKKKKHHSSRQRRNSDGDDDDTVVSELSRRSTTEHLGGAERERALIKVKKPSPLRRMFTSPTVSRH